MQGCPDRRGEGVPEPGVDVFSEGRVERAVELGEDDVWERGGIDVLEGESKEGEGGVVGVGAVGESELGGEKGEIATGGGSHPSGRTYINTCGCACSCTCTRACPCTGTSTGCDTLVGDG